MPAPFATCDDAQPMRRGLLGVELAPVPAAGAHGAASGRGALILRVLPGTPAAAADLKPGDIITRIDDNGIASINDFHRRMRLHAQGDEVLLDFRRDGHSFSKKLTLAERPREVGRGYEVFSDSIRVEDLRLRTFITRPLEPGRHPAILLIPPPLPKSLEFPPSAADHPLKRAIDDLTRAGIVTMRVDRVGVGDSDGDDPSLTRPRTDVAAFRTAIRALAARPEVDPGGIFLFANGAGSALAPLAAEGEAVRGIAVYGATIARPLPVSISEQFRRRWQLQRVAPPEIERRSSLLQKYLHAVDREGALPADVLRQQPELRAALAGVVQPDEVAWGLPPAYFRELIAIDFDRAWSGLNVPVLAMWGEADWQAARADAEFIVNAVNRSHAGRAAFRALSGVDHALCRAKSPDDSYMSNHSAGEYHPVVVEELVYWIRSQTAR